MIFTSVTVTPEAQKAYLRKQVAKKSGPSDPTTSGTGLSEPLSPVPQKALKRTANQALDDTAGPSKPTKKNKA
ncbi:hypothetical protein BDP27DRAFT_1312761 [Rhodocollybia butyracea]|uniref:Uncharacterized protein n=1 Tax=Rhodocollybia butyracea TaxID=206335 RepID=A0A9P5Q916_9AGAR|nr:hypothetical protein BDP27DRAFT_1312761 [Rhodocollybia butyracea]